MVYGENISQTLQFVVSGNATLGLIASSQIAEGLPLAGSCSWKVPGTMHGAIDQQAVLLRNSMSLVAAQQFMDFLQTPQVTAILQRRGYTVPE
jgi:molybdate transport system substrate-binding protein